MEYKRTHARIPLSAKATLIDSDNLFVQANIVDLSVDGITVTDLPHTLVQSDYRVEMSDCGEHVARFGVRLVYQDDSRAGFQITVADGLNLKNIIRICYQKSRQQVN